MSETENSVFQSALPLREKLERARMELLDLSARNRLLNIPQSNTVKQIAVIDERSEHIFRLLVNDAKTFTFVAGRADKANGEGDSLLENEDSSVDLQQPEEVEEGDDSTQPSTRHVDTKLQTRMTPKGLQKRLLDLYHDSRTLEEEQGVNILFLSLGTLKWIDPNNKDSIRFAPLILVPVMLERGTAGEKFRLKSRQEELTPNLSLEAYLEKVHRLRLPSFEATEEFDISGYMREVGKAIATKSDWAVQANDITLGFFSFAKFLMYRDLAPESWPEDNTLTSQPIIRSLLDAGFDSSETLLPDDTKIDVHIPPAAMLHIVDSDSSQTLAVDDVRKGRNIVIQGPPGTGKSQTIANIIASAVADGKTVLFVAEKMAALDVVKRRLDHAGVGDACLELHSNKSNKKAVLDELRRTWDLGSPRGEFPTTIIENLTVARDVLNDHALRMHDQHGHSRLSPYQVIGQLIRLKQSESGPAALILEGERLWTADDLRMRIELVSELVQRIADIGLPQNHPWNGVGLETILPSTIDRLVPRIKDLQVRTTALAEELPQAAISLGITSQIASFKDLQVLKNTADLAASAPPLSSAALHYSGWEEAPEQIHDLVDIGSRFESLSAALEKVVHPTAINADIAGITEELSQLPANFSSQSFVNARLAAKLIPELIAETGRLQRELGFKGSCDTLIAIEKLVTTGERVAVAPDASPDAFAATVWEHGIDQAGDLVDAVAELEKVRTSLDKRILDSAWETDVKQARTDLATRTGVFRFLSGSWRRSRALARSIVQDPATPTPELIRLLNEITQGQTALARVRAGDTFGRSAFGAGWRGERSNSLPLLVLVDWMRTLRGLGSEPRLLASQLADRSGVGARTKKVREVILQLKSQLSELWVDLGPSVSSRLENPLDFDRASLDAWNRLATGISRADELFAQIFRTQPDAVLLKLASIRQLAELQTVAKRIDLSEQLGKSAFAEAWTGRSSNWALLKFACQWIAENANYRHVVADLQDRKAATTFAYRLVLEADSVMTEINNLSATLHAQPTVLFNANSSDAIEIVTVDQKLKGWLIQSEHLSQWVLYQHRAVQACRAGMAQLVDQLALGSLKTDRAQSVMERSYYESIFAEMVEKDPALARFDGDLHTRRVAGFVELDRSRIKAASLEVVRAHHRRIPPKEGGAGPVGVLRAEMARRRGHMPIRQLMNKAGAAVQALKPVMMMSPLSVAQFLVPGRQTFDLLVMDEASQIQPVDAIGAIARCKQVVVVGDERQLPPTKFFAKMTGSDPNDEDESAQVADIESILGLFVARGLPQRMLKWHYRSRHQSLIAVSNSQFYKNQLFIVPSPYTQEAGMGLQFQYVEGGTFDTGGTGTNVVEAKTVAQAIIGHAKTQSELSLGVATFSVAQRRAVQDELELLRRLNPETEDFFHAHPSEPFFVKNLENVQGDERDVIMISVGYAKNSQGNMAMRFGPLGADGGERRLNVLISRAKRRCQVFASITDEDIDLSRAKGVGVFAFKLFLHYARTGRLSMAESTQRTMDSAFEEQVANALQAHGYQVHPQVGIAGFFIDLAIADPSTPGRYLIGIECDGASYHSARSARDRDRLRQAVLEDHGWIIHRIWSTDWFQRPQEQLARTVSAIEAARAALAARLEAGQQNWRAVPIDIVTVDRGEITEIGLNSASPEQKSVHRYIESSPASHAGYELHETPVGLLADLVEHIVSVESPIHIDEVITRLRTSWGLQRAGARIEAAVEHASKVACTKGNVVREGPFLMAPLVITTLRDRQAVLSPNLRKPEMIAPKEIAAGVLDVVATNLGATDDEIAIAISRMLGFKSTSSTLRKAVEGVVETLLVDGRLRRQQTLLVIGAPA